MHNAIDISKFQGSIDFNKVKKSGIQYVIIRAGYGRCSNQKDPKFDQNVAGCKKVGLPFGVYWYSYANSIGDAQKEADTCYEIIKSVPNIKFIAYDVEDKTQVNLKNSNLVANLSNTFLDFFKSKGYTTIFYSYQSFVNNSVNLALVKSHGHDFWLACYSGNPTTTDYSGVATIWQYSSSGHVDGISNRVDMNVMYKDYGVVSSNITRSDTSGNFKVEYNTEYTFKITSVTKPTLIAGSNTFVPTKSRQYGNDYYFTFKAVGKVGSGCGFYLNRGKSPVAVAQIVNAYCDTPKLNLVPWGKYTYLIKSRGNPAFVCGTAGIVNAKLIKTERKDMNYYYYQVTSTGKVGGVGIYMNGERISIINVMIAPFTCDTSTVKIPQGHEYQAKITCAIRPSLYSQNSNIVQVLDYCQQQGNSYLMKIKAVGHKGQICRVYINGSGHSYMSATII